MDSDDGSRCSHRLGFPIRTSPDHSLLAASRSFSQLTTSFIACLRLGIHTHALSSLTIKSTLRTPLCTTRYSQRFALLTCVLVMPVNILLSKIERRETRGPPIPFREPPPRSFLFPLVGLGRIELPTSPLSGVRSSQLSYRPGPPQPRFTRWWSWSGSNRRPPECKSGALPAELHPLNLRQAAFAARPRSLEA